MPKSTPRPGLRYPPEIQEALTWLGMRPAEDPLNDLAPMADHLVAIAAARIPTHQYLKILELFQTRAGLAGSTVKPLLLDATLPVPKRLRSIAHGLISVHGELAAGLLKTLRETPPDEMQRLKRAPAYLCDLGLANLAQQYEATQFVSAQTPPEFWTRALAFYRHSVWLQTQTDDATETARRRMKGMLAFAAAQPEGFSPREAAFLADYLRIQADTVEIRAADQPWGEDDYWLDPAQGIPPATAPRRPVPHDASLNFSCAALSRRAHDDLSRLEQGAPPEVLDLPHSALSADYRSVLARAAERWASPPKRQTHRRRHGYRVQVCTHLGSLWQHSGDTGGGAEVELPASDWMILNESPSGYAIMHVAGQLAGLVAGAAIGLRPSADQPWNICVVRWARSENPEHIELGLEVVAPLAEAVRIARRGCDDDPAPIPALLLPPLPAIGRGEALLTARGYFAPGAFALINETPGRIRVSECSASHLSMHTACIEIFEFQRKIDPD